MERKVRGPEAERPERGGDRLNFIGGMRLGVNEQPVTVKQRMQFRPNLFLDL